MLGLDALSSAAYGPEAAMTLLIPLGAAGLGYIGPISAIIIVLLLIVFLSYRQTIAAYPGRRRLLHGRARRISGCSRDCWRPRRCCSTTCSSWRSASRPASARWCPRCRRCSRTRWRSAWRSSRSSRIVNLRGVRESGVAFVVPTYLFVVCLFAVLAIGLVKTWLAHGHPVPVVAPPAGAAASDERRQAAWIVCARSRAAARR